MYVIVCTSQSVWPLTCVLTFPRMLTPWGETYKYHRNLDQRTGYVIMYHRPQLCVYHNSQTKIFPDRPPPRSDGDIATLSSVSVATQSPCIHHGRLRTTTYDGLRSLYGTPAIPLKWKGEHFDNRSTNWCSHGLDNEVVG